MHEVNCMRFEYLICKRKKFRIFLSTVYYYSYKSLPFFSFDSGLLNSFELKLVFIISLNNFISRKKNYVEIKESGFLMVKNENIES